MRITSHFLLGMTILVPFKMSPSSMVNSSWNVQYGWRIGGIYLMLLSHPVMMVYFSKASSSSAWLASQSSCNLLLLTRSCCDIWCTYSLSNLIMSFWYPNLDKQSANWFLGPRIYLTVKLYGKVLIRMHWSLGVVWLRLLDRIASSSFWSVSSMKWCPYKNGGIFQLPRHQQGIQFQLLHILSVSQLGIY